MTAPRDLQPDELLADHLAANRADRALTQEERENELRDRIAVLEQRNGALDADLFSSRQQHADTAASYRRLTYALDKAERRVEELTRTVERLSCEKVALQEDNTRAWGTANSARARANLLEQSLTEARREANTVHAQVDTAAEASSAWSEVHADTTLLEAQGGVFVPIPAGHMLSVTVTPYADAEPLPAEVFRK